MPVLAAFGSIWSLDGAKVIARNLMSGPSLGRHEATLPFDVVNGYNSHKNGGPECAASMWQN
jgi:hypothetical protein